MSVDVLLQVFTSLLTGAVIWIVIPAMRTRARLRARDREMLHRERMAEILGKDVGLDSRDPMGSDDPSLPVGDVSKMPRRSPPPGSSA